MRHRSSLYLDDELAFKLQRFLHQYYENTGVRLSKNKFIEALIMKTLNENSGESLSKSIKITVLSGKES